ncbi:MAG: hypothetical protein Fur0041_14700 [Bacteroidia bacterium]
MKRKDIAVINRSVSLFAVVLMLMSFSFSGSQNTYSLYIAVYDVQAAKNNIVHIRKVNMQNGIPAAAENWMDITTKLDGDKTPRIRFDLGENKIHRNRWLITAYGNVIDLAQKKVLVDSHDKFVKASGDSIVFYTSDIFKGRYYSLLDLKTGQYTKINNPAYKAIAGRDVEADCSMKNYRLYYYPVAAPKKEIVKDAGYGEDISLITGAKPQVPVFWIDQDNFLYPNYAAQRDYVAVMKVNVISGAQEKVGEIDRLPENRSLSFFYINPLNDIVYHCAAGHFKIDLKKKKAEELKDLPVGNGFTVASSEISDKGREIKYEGQIIGTYFCDPSTAVTTPGHIAFPFEMKLGDERFLQGAAVWNSTSKKWKTTGDSDLAAVLGWTNQ